MVAIEELKYINRSYDELIAIAKDRHNKYINAVPFPNTYFDNFFDEELLNEILEEFPDLQKNPDIKFNDANQIKLASKGEFRFGPKTKEFMHFLNSQPFLDFLSELTGIDALIPDPYFEGGGCHQILPGGLLKVHADFNKHRVTNLDRRLNVLIYLNKDWDESYGGHFELWDKEMKNSITKILPLFNRMAMFSTTSHSYHGHPNPLNCPPGRSRKSLALYYYSNGRPSDEVEEGLEEHNTLFVARQGTKDAEEVEKQKHSAKNIIKSLVPPIIYDNAKKLFK